MVLADFWSYVESQKAVDATYADKAKWAKMAKCSQDTAYRDILDLVRRGALEKDAGGGRSTSYSLAWHKAGSG